MTAPWNGRPPAPLDEVQGWHWLKNKGVHQDIFPMQWVSDEFCDAPTEWRWDEGDQGDGCPDDMAKYCEYVGPCLTPDQIAAQIAEAVKGSILALTWDRVHWETSMIDFQEPNVALTGKRRSVVPMTRALRTELEKALRPAVSREVMPDPKRSAGAPRPI